MKKLVSLIIALLVMACPMMAMAGSFDGSVFQGLYFSSIATLDLNEDGSVAFVESQLTAATRSFTTPYEHPRYYNSTLWDIVIPRYDTGTPAPRIRLWIRSYGTQFANIEGVSFQLNGKTYTFTGVSDPERQTYKEEEDAYTERLLIIFDDQSLDFIAEMEAYCETCNTVEAMNEHPITMILHGDEDIVVTLGSGFMSDFMIIKELFIDCGGLDYLKDGGGNTMIVR